MVDRIFIFPLAIERAQVTRFVLLIKVERAPKPTKLKKMIDNRKNKSLQVLFFAFLSLGLVALFPPRQTAGNFHDSAGRGILFDPNFSQVTTSTSSGSTTRSYEINAGRLLAEALLIASIASGYLVYLWSDNY